MKHERPRTARQDGRRRLAAVAALGMLALSGVGCSPASENEQEYFRNLETKRQEREALREAIEKGPYRDDDAVRLVKESPAEDGEGTTEDWLERQAKQVGGQVLFPRWIARRRGSGKYEVRYTYTLLGDEHEVEKHSYVWNADPVLQLVGPSRFVRREDSLGNRRQPPSTSP